MMCVRAVSGLWSPEQMSAVGIIGNWQSVEQGMVPV